MLAELQRRDRAFGPHVARRRLYRVACERKLLQVLSAFADLDGQPADLVTRERQGVEAGGAADRAGKLLELIAVGVHQLEHRRHKDLVRKN
jgi:hypothetical protein